MNDKTRIENAIIPMLIFNTIQNIVDKYPSQKEFYEKAIEITRQTTNQYLEDLDKKKEAKRHKRLARIARKIYKYFQDNKYDTRKALLVLTLWAFALAEKDALELYAVEYVELLQELDATFDTGYDVIENFDKIHASAAKQVGKIHSIVQQEGYF